MKFDGTVVSKDGLKSDCTFSLTVPLPIGPKDRCSCESEQESSITKAIVPGQTTKKRHPRKLEITKEILREELGNITALHYLGTPGHMHKSSSTNHTLRTELTDTPPRTQTGYEVVYTHPQIWTAFQKVRKLN